MTTTITGYCEFAYLNEVAYMGGRIDEGLNTQISMKIEIKENVNAQSLLKINDADLLFSQIENIINSENNLNLQTLMKTESQNDLNLQNILKINDSLSARSQIENVIFPRLNLNSQTELKIKSANNLNSQIELKNIIEGSNLNSQVNFGTYRIKGCGGYLDVYPYLQDDPYLTPRNCAELNSQVELRKYTLTSLNSQIDQKIEDLVSISSQVLAIVNRQNNLGSQINFQAASKINSQINLFIYNRTQLRILLDFPSRGTTALGGNNWTSVQAIAPGDYSPSNLNTDIIEQRTQTDGINNLWQLRCDTGEANTFMDTAAILEHNFTTSARVEIQGSDDPAFGTIKFTIVMETELQNMYYIAPSLPTQSARYYQFSIQDPTNTDPDGLKIGTILFGSAIVLTKKEQFINPVTFGKRHYKDTLETEGYTSSSNDRALRKFLNLTFTQLDINGGNFKSLQDYILTAKTDLKCLVIPRPTKPSALAVFAKLSTLPDEQHNAVDDDNWRVDLTLDWDESL